MDGAYDSVFQTDAAAAAAVAARNSSETTMLLQRRASFFFGKKGQSENGEKREFMPGGVNGNGDTARPFHSSRSIRCICIQIELGRFSAIGRESQLIPFNFSCGASDRAFITADK